MQIIPLLLKELDQEAQITRKMLSLIPADKFDWQPHEKSMKMKILAVHIGELPGWISMGLATDGLDFEKAPYQPTSVNDTAEIVDLFERSLAEGKASLSSATEDDLLPTWTLRNGSHVLAVMSKYELVRHSYAQTIHHRAQLGVYLRLLNIPIPGSYGPSADEMNF
jgi:uncharacterized damage-inducible protein DinB